MDNSLDRMVDEFAENVARYINSNYSLQITSDLIKAQCNPDYTSQDTRCQYFFQRPPRKGQRCPNDRASGSIFCNSCKNKKGAQKILKQIESYDGDMLCSPPVLPDEYLVSPREIPLPHRVKVVGIKHGDYIIDSKKFCLKQSSNGMMNVYGIWEEGKIRTNLTANEWQWAKNHYYNPEPLLAQLECPHKPK